MQGGRLAFPSWSPTCYGATVPGAAVAATSAAEDAEQRYAMNASKRVDARQRAIWHTTCTRRCNNDSSARQR